MPFNVPPDEGEDIVISAWMRAELMGEVSRSDNTVLELAASAGLWGSAVGTAGVRGVFRGVAELSGSAVLSAYARDGGSVSASLQGKAGLGLNRRVAWDASGELMGRVALVPLLSMAMDAGATLLCKTDWGLNRRIKGAWVDASLWGQTATYSFNIGYIEINIPVPQGSTLVIDSGGYVVLLDGEDVIWAHAGDWLRLSRNVHDLSIEGAGAGSLRVEMLYTERWL